MKTIQKVGAILLAAYAINFIYNTYNSHQEIKQRFAHAVETVPGYEKLQEKQFSLYYEIRTIDRWITEGITSENTGNNSEWQYFKYIAFTSPGINVDSLLQERKDKYASQFDSVAKQIDSIDTALEEIPEIKEHSMKSEMYFQRAINPFHGLF
jgi:hypothetical protein